MTKDNRTSLKASHGAHNRNEPHKRGLLLSFIIFIAWVAGIGLLLSLIACQPVNAKPIATNTNNGYYIDLSNLTSGQASRYLLAFFVPKFWLASQASQDKDTTHHPKSIGVNRHIMPALAKIYDGVTLQNKRKPICRAVTNEAESEPHHPMIFHSVITTQDQSLGGYRA